MAKNIDWNALKAEYVTGTMTYRQLARDRGVSNTALSDHGKEEGWAELRQQYRIEAAQKAIDSEVDNEAERLAAVIKAANSMQGVILNVLGDDKQFYRHLVQDEIYNEEVGAAVKTTEERIYKKADTRAIRDLTGAIRDMTSVLRNLYNLPTQAEREAQRIAAERLNMDKRKADMDENVDKNISVVFKGEGSEEFSE